MSLQRGLAPVTHPTRRVQGRRIGAVLAEPPFGRVKRDLGRLALVGQEIGAVPTDLEWGQLRHPRRRHRPRPAQGVAPFVLRGEPAGRPRIAPGSAGRQFRCDHAQRRIERRQGLRQIPHAWRGQGRFTRPGVRSRSGDETLIGRRALLPRTVSGRRQPAPRAERHSEQGQGAEGPDPSTRANSRQGKSSMRPGDSTAQPRGRVKPVGVMGLPAFREARSPRAARRRRRSSRGTCRRC